MRETSRLSRAARKIICRIIVVDSEGEANGGAIYDRHRCFVFSNTFHLFKRSDVHFSLCTCRPSRPANKWKTDDDDHSAGWPLSPRSGHQHKAEAKINNWIVYSFIVWLFIGRARAGAELRLSSFIGYKLVHPMRGAATERKKSVICEWIEMFYADVQRASECILWVLTWKEAAAPK